MSETSTSGSKRATVTKCVVDAHEGTVYGGTVHETLQTAYDDTGKRVLPTPRTTHIGKVQPVLARTVTEFDPVSGENVTTWYPVNLDNVQPGPLPGEYKMIHLLPDNEV